MNFHKIITITNQNPNAISLKRQCSLDVDKYFECYVLPVRNNDATILNSDFLWYVISKKNWQESHVWNV